MNFAIAKTIRVLFIIRVLIMSDMHLNTITSWAAPYHQTTNTYLSDSLNTSFRLVLENR